MEDFLDYSNQFSSNRSPQNPSEDHKAPSEPTEAENKPKIPKPYLIPPRKYITGQLYSEQECLDSSPTHNRPKKVNHSKEHTPLHKLNQLAPNEIQQILEEEYHLFLEGHTNRVTSIALTNDNQHIISASIDGTIRLC